MASKTMTATGAWPSRGRVRVVMTGMLLTLMAAISLSAWAQPAPPSGGMGMEGHGMHRGMHGDMGGGMDGKASGGRGLIEEVSNDRAEQVPDEEEII